MLLVPHILGSGIAVNVVGQATQKPRQYIDTTYSMVCVQIYKQPSIVALP